MTPQELKNSILQLAIQGKLVEQRPEEGTAEELYQQIQAEKQKLIKAGKIKKEKPLPEIAEDEKPFDIPESWKWVTLSQITSELSLNDGNWVLSDDMVTLGAVKLIQLGSIGNCKYVEKGFKYLTEEHFSELNGRQIFEGYLLINRLIGDRMLCCILPQIDGILGTAVDVCWIAPSKYYESKYLMYMLASPMFQSEVKSVGAGTTRFRVSKGNLIKLYFPLPPLAEQKRIVAKIEELLPLIDRYEEAWTKLEAFNKRLPDDMQKSLLQMAIRGKLVEQRPEEGTGEELYQQIQTEKQALVKSGKIKKDKPLPEITDDEKPFDIPESWKWVHINDVIDVRDGTHDTPKYVSDGVPLVTSKNLIDGGIDFDTAKLISVDDSNAINLRSKVDDGDILFAMIGTIGNPVLIKKDREFSIKNMALFKQYNEDLFEMKYLLYFLRLAQSEMKKVASASVQSFVSLSVLRNYLMPLPPLAEQKRIVAKLEELLPLCERLK